MINAAPRLRLIHDVEDRLLDRVRRDPRRQQSADPEMPVGPLAFGNQRIGRLLDPVVEERVAAIQAKDETGPNRLPQSLVDLLLGFAMNQGQGRRSGRRCPDRRVVPRLPASIRQPAQLRCHQVSDVVGEALGADARQIPGPGRRAMVECEQALFGQRSEELNREERIAVGLLMHQLRERRAISRSQ